MLDTWAREKRIQHNKCSKEQEWHDFNGASEQNEPENVCNVMK